MEETTGCVDGKALDWLQMVGDSKSNNDIRRELIDRFRHSQQGDLYEMLMALRQEGLVTEHRERFERLLAPMKDAPKECLTGAFKRGLKPSIRAELCMMHVGSL